MVLSAVRHLFSDLRSATTWSNLPVSWSVFQFIFHLNVATCTSITLDIYTLK